MRWWASASPLVHGSVGARPGALEGGGPDAAGVAAARGELHPLAGRRERDVVVLRRVGAAGGLLLGEVDDQHAEDDVPVRLVLGVDDRVRADRTARLGNPERS